MRQVHADPDAGRASWERKVPAAVPVGFKADAEVAVCRAVRAAWSGAAFFQRDSKRLLQKEISAVCTEQKKKVVCVLDEAHLLGKDMLEELRFLLNHEFDSSSPMSLVLVGQSELWEQKLRLQAYTAIRQRIDMNIVLGRLDRAETGKYIASHLAYSGVGKEIFTSGAEEEIYKISAGIPRMINRVCEKTLMYACQQQKTAGR